MDFVSDFSGNSTSAGGAKWSHDKRGRIAAVEVFAGCVEGVFSLPLLHDPAWRNSGCHCREL